MIYLDSGIALLILGGGMLAYSLLGDRVGLDFGLNWPNWLLAVLLFSGVLLLLYGTYLVAERSKFSSDTPQGTQFMQKTPAFPRALLPNRLPLLL